MNTSKEMTDIDIIKIAKSFSKGILDGKSTKDQCYVVCLPLQSYLSFLKVECELMEGEIKHEGNEWHHFWITLKDGRIIDPTASQFTKSNGRPMKNIYLRRLSYYKPYTRKDIDNKIRQAVRDFATKNKP